MNGWYLDYFGKPYVPGAEGPDSYDCWGLVRAVQRAQFGIDIPALGQEIDRESALQVRRAFRDSPERDNWVETAERIDGQPVFLYRSEATWRNDTPGHIGLWMDVNGGSVLHALRAAGVVVSDRAALHLDGWTHFRHFRRACHD